MIRRKALAGAIPLLIIWLMASALLWGFVFNVLTTARPEHKLVLFIDARVPDPLSMAVELEKDKPEHIRMVEVHPFSYDFMDSDIGRSDLYIVREDELGKFAGGLVPVPEALRGGVYDLVMHGGEPYGIRVHEPGEASPWITYEDAGYVLVFGAESRHLTTNEKGVDDEAIPFAERVIGLLNQSGKE